eukprot:4209655-Pyramimonas_sp.AAC.2
MQGAAHLLVQYEGRVVDDLMKGPFEVFVNHHRLVGVLGGAGLIRTFSSLVSASCVSGLQRRGRLSHQARPPAYDHAIELQSRAPPVDPHMARITARKVPLRRRMSPRHEKNLSGDPFSLGAGYAAFAGWGYPTTIFNSQSVCNQSKHKATRGPIPSRTYIGIMAEPLSVLPFLKLTAVSYTHLTLPTILLV